MKQSLLTKINFPTKQAPQELKGMVFSKILKEKSQIQFIERMNLVYRITIGFIFLVVAFGIYWVYYLGNNIDNGTKIDNIEITQSGIDTTIDSLDYYLTMIDNDSQGKELDFGFTF